MRAQQAHAPRAGTRNRRRRRGDASFARSFDPCTSILTMLRGESFGGGALATASRLGNLGVTREEPALGPGRTDGARLAAGHRSRKGSSVVGKKRKGIAVPVPARHESRGLVARTSNAVAEVDRRRLASNKLGKRAPKRAAGSSERGPSSERRPVGETIGRRVERNEKSRVGLTGKHGRGPAPDPGWREIVIQRSSHRQKRWGGRGAGAVMATGSYEGSLSMEGIPDHHEASFFTERRPRWSRRPIASSDPYAPTS
jgi:hypothetical protein